MSRLVVRETPLGRWVPLSEEGDLLHDEDALLDLLYRQWRRHGSERARVSDLGAGDAKIDAVIRRLVDSKHLIVLDYSLESTTPVPSFVMLTDLGVMRAATWNERDR